MAKLVTEDKHERNDVTAGEYNQLSKEARFRDFAVVVVQE